MQLGPRLGFGARSHGISSTPPPFDPSSLPGLALWLDASDTTTIDHTSGAVNQWNDKSGNIRHFSQTIASQKPLSGNATINGHNAIKFDGIDDLLTSPSFIYGLGSCSIYMVASAPPQTGERMLLSESRTSSATPVYRFGTINDGVRTYYRTDSNSARINYSGISGINNGMPYISSCVDTGTNMSLYTDGVLETSLGYTRSTTTLNICAIGALKRLTEDSFYNVSVGEILVYAGNHNDTDRAIVENYLRRKWMKAESIDMLFLLGESNADGRASVAAAPEPISSFYSNLHPNLQIYYKPAVRTGSTLNTGSFVNNGMWWALGLAHDATVPKTHQTIGNASSTVASQSATLYGVELEYARRFYADNPTGNLWIIKAGIGGSRIETDWKITTPDSTSLWTWFKDFVYAPAYIRAVAKNKTPILRGAVWIQGINDIDSTNAPLYEGRLQTLVTRLNTELFAVPGKIAIIGLPSTATSSDALTIKAAQTSVAAANSNTILIKTDGSGANPAVPMQADNLHYTTEGMSTLAGYIYDAGV